MKSINISQHIAEQIATIRVTLWPKVDQRPFLHSEWEDIRIPMEEAHCNVRINSINSVYRNMQWDIKIKAER